MEYYLDIEGETKGPYTLHQLRSMWNTGAITGKTKFTKPGFDKWHALETIQTELEGQDAKTPPALARIEKKSDDFKSGGCMLLVMALLCFGAAVWAFFTGIGTFEASMQTA